MKHQAIGKKPMAFLFSLPAIDNPMSRIRVEPKRGRQEVQQAYVDAVSPGL